MLRGFFFILVFMQVLGCSSVSIKNRAQLRDKIVSETGFYCDFLSGEQYPDIHVALNIQVGQKCDVSKPLHYTHYRGPGEVPGLVFCCHLKSNASSAKLEREVSKKVDTSVSEGKQHIPSSKVVGSSKTDLKVSPQEDDSSESEP